MSAPGNNSSYAIVGSGGFGAVIRPAFPNTNNGVERSYPRNVTKVFYNKKTLNAVLGKSKEIFNLMNAPFPNRINHGHAVYPYSKRYTLRNLPANLRSNLESKFSNSEHAYPSNNEQLQLVRMPDLGIDIFMLNDDIPAANTAIAQLRNVSFHKLYYQFFKLFIQTYSLGRRGLIHNDIRDTNVMIKPETGEINIIDFDLMLSFDDTHHEFKKGSSVKYQYPPECLMYANLDIVENPDETEDMEIIIRSDHKRKFSKKLAGVFRNYGIDLIECFDKVVESYGIDGMDNKAELYSKLMNANLLNLRYIRGLIRSGVKNVFHTVLKTIDNYGLSLSMLQILAILYPNVLVYGKQVVNINNDKTNSEGTKKEKVRIVINKLSVELKPLITNNGTPYTDEQLYSISRLLLNLTSVLNQASSFELEQRPSSLEIVFTLKHGYNELVTIFLDKYEAKAAVAYTDKVLSAVYPEGAAAGGAGAGAAGGAGRNHNGGGSKCRRRIKTFKKRQ